MEAVLLAARYEKVEPGSGQEWLNETFPQEQAVFESWTARLDARRNRRSRPLTSRRARPS